MNIFGLKCLCIAVAMVFVTGLPARSVLAEDAIKVPPVSAVFQPSVPGVTFERADISIRKQNGDELYLDVELAMNPQQLAQGLMYRTHMAENEGMLFLFDNVDMRSFWMKNTLIPLDMLFLHPDGTIHHIHHNAKPQDLTQITSKYPSKAVLELNGGTSDKMGIKEGHQVVHPFFKNTGQPR